MKRKLFFLLPLAVCIYAASQEPVAVYTFTCTGNASQRVGPCPQGGRPISLIQGSDSNFYGAAQVSSEQPEATGARFSR